MNITKSLRKEDVDRQWYIIDATDKVLGRLSTEVAIRYAAKISLHTPPMLIPAIM